MPFWPAWVCCSVAWFQPAVACSASALQVRRTAPAGQPPGRPSARDSASTASVAPPATGIGGLLAGRVIDSYNRQPTTATYIQVVCKEDKQGGAPIDVTTDTSGFFTIQGLKPGRHYQLIARTKDGDRLLAGTTYAMPPDPKVLIRISEDFVTSDTPAMPAAPVYPGPRNGNNGPSPKRTAELGAPIPGGSTPAQLRSGAPVPAAVAPAPDRMANNGILAQAPVTNIPVVPGDPSALAYVAPPVAPALTRPLSAPSCTLVGNKVENLALYDLEGHTWEFRKHKGRLVLFDFWGTWCLPCQEAIPHLKDLQYRYGPYGLEVVGIAEEYGSAQEQVRRVKAVTGRLGVNYTVLLGGGFEADCPVKARFEINSYPTLVLVDENGQILRRWHGLDRQNATELEAEIKKRLRVK